MIMTPEQAAAFVNAQTACALAEIEGMRAANAIAVLNEKPMPYGYNEFSAVPSRFGIEHNTVLQLFEDVNRY